MLIDLLTGAIISNESGDIVRMLNTLDLSDSDHVVDLCPEGLSDEIEQTNEWVYELINNGVYRAGFATSQLAYEAAERDVHAGLRRCDEILSHQRFVCGSTVTEADVRLLPTCARFDAIYASFFRCGRALIRADYPHVCRWLHEMLSLTGDNLFDLNAARKSYYVNLFPLNPGGIVPSGPTSADLGFPDTSSPTLERSAFTWRTPRPS